jgi:FdhD protein
MTLETAIITPRLRWSRDTAVAAGDRRLAEETAVALTHDGSTTAIMMATPADLEDFGVGFSLTEGLIAQLSDIADLDVVVSEVGIEVRLWLSGERSARLAARRRHLAGPTGCGLCGIESLAEAVRAPPPITENGFSVTARELLAAMAALEAGQAIGPATRAVHAAGLWTPQSLLVREDVGRHNALDKLVGAVAREGRAAQGVLLLTSRVSVEMIQKAAVMGASIVCAISAPTALAVRTADAAGLTLVAVARSDGFEVFTRPERVRLD